MNAKSIWIGLAGCWLVVGVIAALFIVGDEDGRSPAAAPEIPVAQASADDETQELLELEKKPAVQPLPAEPEEETVEETTTKHNPEGTESGDKSTETERISTRKDVSLVGGQETSTSETSIGSVYIPEDGTLSLPQGEVSIDGDFDNHGKVVAGKTTLIFDGADQTISGDTTAGKIILRGGTKRIRRGTLQTANAGNAEPGKAQLVVEAGTTLIIEKDGNWKTPNAYGFHIAGHLIIDGGVFRCSFSNGNGTDRGAEAWVDGSQLTIYSGKFIGGGDADFSGCTINIHDGGLEINDDIWNSGDELNIYGGYMRNRSGGGMFYLTGNVNIRGGELYANQNSDRSLRIHKDASVYCTSGRIVLGGQNASTNGGILLGTGATLPDMTVNVSTRIHQSSDPNAWLTIGGTLEIAKGRRFEAHGHDVFTNFVPTQDSGEFIP